ncbi:MAG: methyltransferase domain-containing protein [Candidatus Peribacteria bacterium]|nr:MAG: methyltransferase domain-containing protein [Candidatus Peribacteria bacterium]
MQYTKLNLASSNIAAKLFPEPWLNVDSLPVPESTTAAYMQTDIRRFPTEWTNQFHVVRASHVLEHFYMDELVPILNEWMRVLKPGGHLLISVPDIIRCARFILDGKDWKGRKSLSATESTAVMTQFLGWEYWKTDQEIGNIAMRHRMLFSEESLIELLGTLGLTSIEAYASADDPATRLGFHDDSQNIFSMSVSAQKPLES